MPNNPDYPDGYLAAREKFSRSFLQMYDELIYQSTPGVGTALITAIFFPVGLLMHLGFNVSRNQLYRDLIQLSTNDAKRVLIEREEAIEALRQHVISLRDCIQCPIQSLEFILRADVLDIIKRNANAINDQKVVLQSRLDDLNEQAERLGTNGQQLPQHLETEINDVKDQLKHQETILDKLRNANFSQASINELFPEHLPRRVSFEGQPYRSRVLEDEPVRMIAERVSHHHRGAPIGNPSFFIRVMAHPATLILSGVIGVACLLALGLLSPMSVGLTVAVSLITVASLGFFASSCAVSVRNREQEGSYAPRLAV